MTRPTQAGNQVITASFSGDANYLASSASPTFAITPERRDGTQFTFEHDEHPKRTSTMEKLASLKPLHPEIEGFSITAGVNDAAGAVVVTDRSFAEQNGLESRAVVRAWASAGVPPADTGLAPRIAIDKALARAGLSVRRQPVGDQ